MIDTKEELDSLEKWRVSASTELDLLQPAEFIPDMNESASRILDQNVYTRVSAQLIGADEWKQDRIEPHLLIPVAVEKAATVRYYIIMKVQDLVIVIVRNAERPCLKAGLQPHQVILISCQTK